MTIQQIGLPSEGGKVKPAEGKAYFAILAALRYLGNL